MVARRRPMSGSDRVSRLLAEPDFWCEFRRVIRKVHRRAHHLIDAEDLLQEVTVQALSRRSQFRGESAEECIAWLRVIAQNVLKDRIRQIARRPRTSALAEGIPLADEHTMTPHGIVQMNEEQTREIEVLNLALAGLAGSEEWILRLRAAGFSYKHIAKLIDSSEQAARQTHRRLLAYVREYVQYLRE